MDLLSSTCKAQYHRFDQLNILRKSIVFHIIENYNYMSIHHYRYHLILCTMGLCNDYCARKEINMSSARSYNQNNYVFHYGDV